ncbi:hypothetical protein B0T11DRAFT_344327 [Plectosphaerella cucumerina]|uniref:Uncharacterized protein n=1 Tax=Plectosphaerella cucumerina TaxID=40658 RepID=A0A8K0TLN9_9PEZI|nr:hypothetical protein B0T11DRAFT_344327 [Plectosphaerella cucumerina]
MLPWDFSFVPSPPVRCPQSLAGFINSDVMAKTLAKPNPLRNYEYRHWEKKEENQAKKSRVALPDRPNDRPSISVLATCVVSTCRCLGPREPIAISVIRTLSLVIVGSSIVIFGDSPAPTGEAKLRDRNTVTQRKKIIAAIDTPGGRPAITAAVDGAPTRPSSHKHGIPSAAPRARRETRAQSGRCLRADLRTRALFPGPSMFARRCTDHGRRRALDPANSMLAEVQKYPEPQC